MAKTVAWQRTATFVAAAVLVAMSGCATRRAAIPKYPRLSQTESLKVLAERAHAVHTVTAEGLLTLTRPDGESVRLDAVVVMAPPENLRLRAWKFGQAVLDLTLTPKGVYLVTPDDPSRKEKIQAAGASAAQLARTWSLLAGKFFDGDDLRMREYTNRLEVSREMDAQTITCEVDRATLTPREYLLRDPEGRTRFTLSLDDYGLVAGIPWAHRLTAVSDRGTIVIAFRSVELNQPVAAGAFVPPRRAERLP